MKNFKIINNSGIKALTLIPYKYSSYINISELAVLSYVIYRNGLENFTLNHDDFLSHIPISGKTLDRALKSLKDKMILHISRVGKKDYFYSFILPSIEELKGEVMGRQIDEPKENYGTSKNELWDVKNDTYGTSKSEVMGRQFGGVYNYSLELDIKDINLELCKEGENSIVKDELKKLSFLEPVNNENKILISKEEEKKEDFSAENFQIKKEVLDVQGLIIDFGNAFKLSQLQNISNAEKIVRVNDKEVILYWINNLKYLNKALVELRKENKRGDLYVQKAFIESVKADKPLNLSYSKEIEEVIIEIKRKESLGMWDEALRFFGVSKPSISDTLVHLCENILWNVKSVCSERKNDSSVKKINFIVSNFSKDDIKNLLNEIFIENKYNYPNQFIKFYMKDVQECLENLDKVYSVKFEMCTV
jgi:hypothetical protein